MSISTGNESNRVGLNSGSFISSSNSSSHQISDIECDTYESVADIFKYPASVPSSATGARDVHSDNSDDEDDRYEKVPLGDDGQVEIIQSYDDISGYLANDKSEHALFPLEPTSTPCSNIYDVVEIMAPSVPTIVESTSYANTLTTVEEEEVEEEPPKLPPKKHSRAQQVSHQESINSPDSLLLSPCLKPISSISIMTPSTGNSFEKFKAHSLDDSELSSQPLNVLPVTASVSVPTNSFFLEEDRSLKKFGSLEPPRIPKKPEPSILKPILSSQSFKYPQVGKQHSMVLQFDNPLQKNVPPAIPKKPVALSVNKVLDEGGIYLSDSLNAKKPKQASLRQDIPEVAAVGEEDGLYKDVCSFDHLNSQLAQEIKAETVGSSRENLSPEIGRERKHDMMEGGLVQSTAPFSPNRPYPVMYNRVEAVEENLQASLPALRPKAPPKTKEVSSFFLIQTRYL